MKRPNCVFIGCVELSQIALFEIDKYFEVKLIIKAPQNKKKFISGYSDLKNFKLKSNPKIIETLEVEKYAQIIKNVKASLIFCIGWPRIIKSEILELKKIMKIGFHSSLLPKYRGGAPINWALINNEKIWGTTLMELGNGVDSGDIIFQQKFYVNSKDTCRTLYLKVFESLVISIKSFSKLYFKKKIKFTKQNEKYKTVFPKRKPSDGLINWNNSSNKIYNFIRAQSLPYPCAFFYFNKVKIKIVSSEPFNTNENLNKFKPGKLIKIIPYRGGVIKCKNGSILIKEIIYKNLPVMLFSTFAKIK
jgi:methionyl-tRNA formyltransferase